MKRVGLIAVMPALFGWASDARACRFPTDPTAAAAVAEQAKRDWQAYLTGTKMVSGNYRMDRDSRSLAPDDIEFGEIVDIKGRVEAKTLLEQPDTVVIACRSAPQKPRPGETGTFYLRKQEADDRLLIVHFEMTGSKND